MTSGCTLEAQRFQRDLAQFKQLGAEVIGISADALDSHALFSKKEGLSFLLASDVGGQVAKRYDSWYGMGNLGVAARNTYLIDPNGKIARVFTNVNPTGHSEEVLAALRQLQTRASRG
jgi:peroxiredoxin Q/BCP